MRYLPVLFLLLGCSENTPLMTPMRIMKDSRGKEITFPKNPKRIVSLLPSVTELLFAVGAGDQIVGVTSRCIYPPEARSIPRIGDVIVNFEKIFTIQPDLIITDATMTSRTTRLLEEKGFAVFSVQPRNLDEVSDTLRLLGSMTGHVEDAAIIANSMIDKANAITPPAHSPTVYFEASADPIWTSGTDHYAGDIIRRAGGKNIFKGGWEQINWEVVLDRDPEVILISHRKKELLAERAGWSELKAVKNGHVYFVNENWFNIPSPRLLKGLEEASRIFHETNP